MTDVIQSIINTKWDFDARNIVNICKHLAGEKVYGMPFIACLVSCKLPSSRSGVYDHTSHTFMSKESATYMHVWEK